MKYFKRRKWTPREQQIIREMYPQFGPAHISVLLPGRSIHSIRSCATRLKVIYGSKKWTVKEDQILKDYYPLLGAKGITEKLNRTKQAISRRARRFGLKMIPEMKRRIIVKNVDHIIWENWEDFFIRRLYPLGGARSVQEKLPSRTVSAIKTRARRLGLRCLRWKRKDGIICNKGYLLPQRENPRRSRKTPTVEEIIESKLAIQERIEDNLHLGMSVDHTTSRVEAALGIKID